MSSAQRSDACVQRSDAEDPDDPDYTWGEGLDIHPWGHAPHAHGSGQLVHAISGRAVFTIHAGAGAGAGAGASVDTRAIDVTRAIWVPPGVWHSARFAPGFASSVHRVDLDPDQVRVRVLVVDATVRAELLATQWRPDGELCHTRAALAAQGRGAAAPPPQPTGPLTLSIVHALDADPGDPRDLDDWARELHTSVMSIRRAFTSETGLTWSAWRTQHRVHAAIHLLQHGERASRAAATVGFSEAGLSAAVRRQLGCTPSALMVR